MDGPAAMDVRVAPSDGKGPAQHSALGLRACGIASLAAAGLLLTLAVWATWQEARLTPLFKPVACSTTSVSFTGLGGNLLTGLSIGLGLDLTCHNPNLYSLTLQERQGGNVYLGEGRYFVATLTTPPDTVLEAESAATAAISGRIDLSISRVMNLLAVLTASEVAVYLDLGVKIDVEVGLLFGTFRTNMNVTQYCGFKTNGLGGSLGEIISAMSSYSPAVGEVACAADGWSELDLVDLVDLGGSAALPANGANGTGAEAAAAGASSFLLEVPEDELEDVERTKTSSLRGAQGLGYSLGCLLLLCSALCAWKLRRRPAASGGRETEPGA